MAKKKKKEALTVRRFIDEILIDQFKIPAKKIVNDTTFKEYTSLDRPDLLISEVEYDIKEDNERQFIENLVAYAEAKDNCVVDDKDWKDAYKQGLKKAPELKMPYFIVTNCKTSYFYNSTTGKEISLNDNPIREFQPLRVLRLIKRKLDKDPKKNNIETDVDTQTSISEAVFNKKLWELANIYRNINFKNITEKIDFTIGFISLKFFEEKAIINNNKDKMQDYWSDLLDYIDRPPVFRTNLEGYIKRLESQTKFKEFKDLMEIVRKKIDKNNDDEKMEIKDDDLKDIFILIDEMGQLHSSGFDLFGAVYEKFASNKEKGDFGEFFTRRHYTHIFSKLLLKDERFFDSNKKFKLLDPACGTGGFLTEAYKTLKNSYKKTGTFDSDAEKFLQNDCIYGYDIKEENISRTKLNMFLVGDGHTNISKKDSLRDDLKENSFDYIATNPPMGNGTVTADTDVISTTRYEIAFLSKIIKLLKIGGKAVVIMPDGFLEGPSLYKYRKEVLEKCNIISIISLPKFAFAPYTKEKTYAIYLEKRSSEKTKIQSDDIWMYIIDNDGYANSDKRFPTKLEKEDGSWMHDEISGWIDLDGNEHNGLLESRWLSFDDTDSAGTTWIDETGKRVTKKKGGFIDINRINNDRYYNLLPEYYLRPYEPNYISTDDLIKEVENLEDKFGDLIEGN
ncbi:N-6 DNA methylase [Halanaerobium saccharolyticum]|uniref:HsdM family class I SAM-dependent methyltransferase n=1 Tax=Halanaerobium saccharolyticum TaxID=43595 RepID=UPI003FCD42D4